MPTKNRNTLLLAIGIALALVGVTGSIGATMAVVRSARTDNATERPDGGSSVEITTPYDGWDSVPSDDPAADDGELHDVRNADVSYRFNEGFWAMSEVEHLDAYDMDVKCKFAVGYPVLEGDFEHLESINELLRSTAMATVHTYYEDPSKDSVDFVRNTVEKSEGFIPSDADALLSSTVDYAVTYNDDNLLSVCFSDQYYLGSELLGIIELRTVNVNLQTGETYVLPDVLTVTEDIATSFVDNLVQTSGDDSNHDGTIVDDECLTVKIGGREALIQGLQGTGELAEKRMSTCLFIDATGRPNLGANYWVSGDDGYVRGWWDVTITDEQLAAARKDSELWELLGLQ